MRNTFKKLLIGTSIAASVSAIATAPAQAGSLTNATIGGTAATDYYVYDANNTNTFLVDSTQANVQKVLDGDATHPLGNVEIGVVENLPDFNKYTTLTGKIGGEDITLSSVTAADWDSKDASGVTLAKRWFDAALNADGFGGLINSSSKSKQGAAYNQAWQMFNNGGREEFSDPNISYVNQDDKSGVISIGLAGHYDATPRLLSALGDQSGLLNQFRDPSQKGKPIQASKIVKYTYNGKTDYLYSFDATNSGLTEKSDGISHNGNYEVTLTGVSPTPAATPEPSVMIGLLGVCGVFAAQRQLKKA